MTARVQHAYKHKSALAIDDVVNTFHFAPPAPGGDLTVAIANQLYNLVLNFYETPAPGASNSVASFIAEGGMAPNRHNVKVYDLDTPRPRTPIAEYTGNFGTANDPQPAGPAEVALCLSYRAPLVSGTVPSRRRGRIYIGPLTAGTTVIDATGHARPDPLILDILVAAGRELAVQSTAIGWPWSVRSGGLYKVDGVVNGGDFPTYAAITHLWADNAYDTQRRRGPSPTARETADV